MSKTITYEKFLDKVYGCFIGKAVTGNIGAPYEGVKMPMELEYMPSMVNLTLPNDDLDLQVLWLDVVEKKGLDFTSYDLLKRFCENCDYSPGEYVVMRRNFMRGVYPPYSGRFSNDFYIEGMGCPIRSEIWGCLAAGNPGLACELAGRDGQLDHYGESVWAEKFMAALESMAFFEDDIEVLIKDALSLIPADSKFRTMAEYTASLCRKYGDIKVVLTKVMFEYGHPDCTNMYQNMAIVIASLLLGGLDIIKTGMLALNCGFDTDCTCASAGSIIGILRGADDLKRAYELDEVTYTLGVRSNRRSDKVYDLAEDIARLAVIFAKQKSTDVIIEGAPDFEPDFESLPDFTLRTDYADMNPSIAPGGECSVVLNITNNTDADAVLDCEISSESNIHCEMPCFKVSVGAHGSAAIPIRFTLDKYCESVSDKNIFTLSANSAVIGDFGICGASAWKLSGPFWRTEPIITTQKILDNIEAKFPYSKYIKESCVKGCGMDRLRHFHLNFHADTETEFMTEEELFKAASDGFASRTHEEKAVFIANDSFTMDELFSFKGPCTAYLSRIIEAPRDMTVFAQVGYSSPFALYVNGELIASRDDCNTWTAENVHLEGIKFKEGENRIVLRMTRVNADAKYNIYFSRGIATAEIHLLTSKNPYRF